MLISIIYSVIHTRRAFAMFSHNSQNTLLSKLVTVHARVSIALVTHINKYVGADC